MKKKTLRLFLLLFFIFTPLLSEEQDVLKKVTEYSIYVGTFDTIDKEGDDKATLYGFEHNNPILFRDTFVGKFSPISGGFITDKNSIYLYTGVQAEYEIGLLNILPSFAPGYYNSGDGKNLGSPLEFRSQIKVSFDILEDAKVGFSYSHISNNDWGDINPGVDNKKISFSKTF
tara:strand:+ start:104 stop:622 length:519 start_codon:yes stop_codon:yes gene_type:complete